METQKPVSLAIVGPFSSGKSTLLNALVGETVQSMGVLPETSMLSHLTWGATRAGRIHMADGRIVEGTFEETRARITELEQSGGAGTVDHVEQSLPQNFLQHLHLWDTPGLNSTYLHHEIVAERAIRTADIILWVTPIDAAVTREEVEKIAKRKPPKTPLLVVINKIDVAEEAELVDAVAGIRKDLDGVATVVQPAAARAALDKAGGAVSEFLGDDGLADLRQAIVRFVVAVQEERIRPTTSKEKGRLKPSEFECPACSEACDASDKYCVCGRDLADQHRACPRCASDNILRRERCRQCNIVFAVAAESDALERQALDDLANLDLFAATAKLRVAVEMDSSVPERCQLKETIQQEAANFQDLVVSARHLLRDCNRGWDVEARRAADVLKKTPLTRKVQACAGTAHGLSEPQRQRRDLYMNLAWRRSPHDVVRATMQPDVATQLARAWVLVANMSRQGAEDATICLRCLGASSMVRQADFLLKESLQNACSHVEQQAYEAAVKHLEDAASDDATLRGRIAAVSELAGQCSKVRSSVAALHSLVQSGHLHQAKQEMEALRTKLMSLRDGWAQDLLLGVEGLSKDIAAHMLRARELSELAGAAETEGRHEDAMLFWNEACSIDRAVQAKRDVEATALPAKIAVREEARSKACAALEQAGALQRSGHLQEASQAIEALRSHCIRSEARWAKDLLPEINRYPHRLEQVAEGARQLVRQAEEEVATAQYEKALESYEKACRLDRRHAPLLHRASTEHPGRIAARDAAKSVAYAEMRQAEQWIEQGQLRQAAQALEVFARAHRDGALQWVKELGATEEQVRARLATELTNSADRSRARRRALTHVALWLLVLTSVGFAVRMTWNGIARQAEANAQLVIRQAEEERIRRVENEALADLWSQTLHRAAEVAKINSEEVALKEMDRWSSQGSPELRALASGARERAKDAARNWKLAMTHQEWEEAQDEKREFNAATKSLREALVKEAELGRGQASELELILSSLAALGEPPHVIHALRLRPAQQSEVIDVGQTPSAANEDSVPLSGAGASLGLEFEAVGQVAATGLPRRIRHKATGIVLVLIPAGEFTMGSPATEATRDRDETEHHRVIRKAFYLGETEVTQAQWQTVMGNNPSRFLGANCPVETVTWTSCQAFMRNAGCGFRLPSEAEWEYACRAESTEPFSFGATITPRQVNYDGDHPYLVGSTGQDREQPVTVKSLPANAWGLYEMHGNVSEWCQDVYGHYPDTGTEEPTGGVGGQVVRGGSWYGFAANCRSAARYTADIDTQNGYVGFRVAKEAPQ